MTRLLADASTTSAIWMTPSEIDGILAATWRTPPTPPIRVLKSDAEVRASGLASDRSLFFMLARRTRSDQTREVAPQPAPRTATDTKVGILDPVRETLRSLSADMGSRAKAVVDRLATELARMKLEGLREFQANIGSDGALLIEWTIGRRRLGINLEPKPADSSWYYVSIDPDRVASASGPMTDLDLPLLLRRLTGE